MARKRWRCFFCDEVFRRHQDAAEHFGVDESCDSDVPACKLAEHEGHLVHYIRKLEAEVRRYQAEDSDVLRAIATLECNQAEKLRQAEEQGYAKGVRDMTAQGYCVEPSAHDAVEAAQ
jgi:hypothetical protein